MRDDGPMNTTQPQNAPPAETETTTEIPIGAGIDFTDPHSPLAPYYLHTSHVVAIGLLVVTFILLNRVPLWHTDVWGHLSFGRWIVQQGKVPTQEPFCPAFSDPQSAGLTANWLSQVGFYLAYATGAKFASGAGLDAEAGGVEMLRFTHATLVLLKLLFLWLAFLRLTQSPGWACAGLGAVLVLSLGNLAVIRPQVIGEVCVAGLLFILARKEISRGAVVCIPLLFLTWANAHGSFLMGLTLLGLAWVGRVAEVAWQQKTLAPKSFWQEPSCRRLFLALGIAVVAIGVVNPSGPWIYTEALAVARHPNVLAMDEWQPLKFTLGAGGHWAYGMTMLLLIGAVLLHRRWFSPTQTLFLAFLIWQPLLHQRMFVWWLLVFPWAVLPHYAAWGAAWAKEREIGGVPSFRKTLVAGMLLFLGVMWSIPLQWLLAGQPTKLEQALSDGTPLSYAKQLTQKPPQGRVFASETLADYLVWNMPEGQRECVYTHVHLFPADHWKRCLVVKFGQKDWKELLDYWQVNLILVEAELHPHLRQRLQEDKHWEILLDETGDTKKLDKRCRWLVAQRKKPLPGK
jgi:hypothetical protein